MLKKALAGLVLVCAVSPALGSLGKGFGLRWFDSDSLYTAERQLVELAMRNPPKVQTVSSPSTPFHNSFGRYSSCRMTSQSRVVTIIPSFCEVSGGQYPAVDGHLSKGTVMRIPIVGLKGKNILLGKTELEAEEWTIEIDKSLPESAEIHDRAKRSGLMPVTANNPIRNSSAACPVVIQSAKNQNARIDSIRTLHETEKAGARDAEADLANGARRLYLSNQTVDRVACKVAQLLAPHQIIVVVQDPPSTHYHAAYLDHYNDKVWQAARHAVGNSFETRFWSAIE